MVVRKTLRCTICFLLVCALSGCSTLGISLYPTGHFLTKQAETILNASPSRANLPRELDLSVEPAHYLQPGDVLLIEPSEFNDNVRLPADQIILADGTVDLGGFGRIQVAGLTLEDSEQAIEQRLVAMEAEPAQVNVRLVESVHRYYVLGEVQSPGAYPLVGYETVLDGILQAGGLTDRASPCKILLARPTNPCDGRVTLPVCYREITQLGNTTTNYQLRPGDRIFVSSRSCCEELLFWQASETCQRCCRCETANCHPEVIDGVSPYVQMLPPPPVIPNWTQDPDREQPGPLARESELIEVDVLDEAVTSDPPSNTLEPKDALQPDGELDFDRPASAMESHRTISFGSVIASNRDLCLGKQ